MVVHPAPGSHNATLVNALLFHCGKSLSGIGGIKRPGIVHRIDKDTSGLLLVAKTDLAHTRLAKQFFLHNVERKYIAFVYGSPSKLDERLRHLPGLAFDPEGKIKIVSKIGRHKVDRKRMAVHQNSGRFASTNLQVTQIFGTKNSPVASLLECQLETGRTHQIRVHLDFLGHGIIGDKIYKSRKRVNVAKSKDINTVLSGFSRQALHAATLGFYHPKTKQWLSFYSEIPTDMRELHDYLQRFNNEF